MVPSAAPRLTLGEVELDLAARTAHRGGATVHLTDKEWALLAHLAAPPGRTVSRDELLEAVWGYSPRVVTRTVDNTVRRLRSKIELNASDPRVLLTIYGEGYRLEPGRAAAPRLAASPGLVGRDDDVERIVRGFASGARWLTVLGPPGIGKSAVARAVAGGWPDRVHWCGVAVVTTGSALETAVATSLSAPTAARGLTALGPSLVVLDNLEQLDASARRLLASWCDAAPGVRFLGTSRARLGFAAERCVDLEPLDPDDAVELFLTRARARRADYAADTAPAVLRALVDAVDRIPLALELAAARTRVLDPDVLLARLSDLDTLGDGDQRMRDAVAWSFSLLDPSDVAATARLSALRAGFTVEAAAALVGLDVDRALSLVDRLVDHSLARPVDGGRRVRMFEVVRQHAAALLDADPDAARTTADRHLDWMLELARGWRKTGARPYDDIRKASTEHLTELLSAQAHARDVGRADDALVLAQCLALPLGVTADWAVAVDRILEAAGDPRVTDKGARARAMFEVASLSAHRRGVEAGAPMAERAWGLALEVGDPALSGLGAHCRGVIALRRARWSEATERFREALAWFDACPEATTVRWRAVVYTDLSQCLMRQGDGLAAKAAVHQGLVLRRRAGDRRGEGQDLLSLGLAHYALGELVDAEQACRAALVVVAEVGDEVHEAKCLANLGAIASSGGRPVESARLARMAADRFAALDHPQSTASALGNLANALGHLGESDEGVRVGEESVSKALAVGAHHLAACNRVYFAENLHEAGRRAEADRILAEAIRVFEAAGETSLRGWALRVRALVHADSTDPDALVDALEASAGARDGWVARAAIAVVRRVAPGDLELPATPQGAGWARLVRLAAGDRSAAAELDRPVPAQDGRSALGAQGDLRRLKRDLRIG